jgi:hypothetical protein
MRRQRRASLLVALIAMLAVAPPTFAQGKGGGKGKQGESHADKQKGGKPEKAQAQKSVDRDKPDHARKSDHGNKPDQSMKPDRGKPDHIAKSEKAVEKSVDRVNSGKSHKFERNFVINDVQPRWRKFAVSNRAPERIAAGVLSRGHARGLSDDDIVIRQDNDRVAFLNRSGVLLVDLDEQRARDLGNWRVRPYYNEVNDAAPSFCRSGEGHPVFGREWCLSKGFGLGDYRDLRWGRTTDVGDIIFRRIDRGTLARDMLINALGDVVFNRLGLHALTLGYSDPLSGVWLGEPTGPQVLRISSGGYPIAEIYDGNRDDRADALVVALRPWY